MVDSVLPWVPRPSDPLSRDSSGRGDTPLSPLPSPRLCVFWLLAKQQHARGLHVGLEFPA